MKKLLVILIAIVCVFSAFAGCTGGGSNIIEVKGDEVMANNLGSNYLFVMSVTELPTKVGEVYFEVTPFVVHGGIKVSGAVESVTATFADGKVIVK